MECTASEESCRNCITPASMWRRSSRGRGKGSLGGSLACDAFEGIEIAYVAVELDDVVENILGDPWSEF